MHEHEQLEIIFEDIFQDHGCDTDREDAGSAEGGGLSCWTMMACILRKMAYLVRSG